MNNLALVKMFINCIFRKELTPRMFQESSDSTVKHPKSNQSTAKDIALH
jgi:hypothetical protein